MRKGSSMKKILSLPLRQIIGDEAVHNVQHEVKNGKHRLHPNSPCMCKGCLRLGWPPALAG